MGTEAAIEVECTLAPLPEYGPLGTPTNKKKYGRYMNSSFWDVKDFGTKRWVVGAYIDSNLPLYRSANLTDEEIVKGCLAYLNKPPKRKKYAKKDPKPKYGELELYKWKIVEKSGTEFVSVLFLTDERKNRLFWGRGVNGR